ncbi:MAG: SAM-dependent chlorinase/fluorinase [Gemmatimonadaceae bacterium]
MATRPLITLLTDFGTADGYVGEMKGAILSLVPDASVIDVAHDIGPQDLEAARLALARYWLRFPPGTIHVVVVDPGVGSSRVALGLASEQRLLIGPDNGVLSPALLMPGAVCVSLPIPGHAAPTFHGRDVFAPAAARLAAGGGVGAIGTPYSTPIIRRTPEPRRLDEDTIQGEVIAIDRFGNAITNLMAAAVRGRSVEVVGSIIPLRRTYSDAPPGSLTAVAGSSGLVELALRDGSAVRSLGIGRGTPVLLRSLPD